MMSDIRWKRLWPVLAVAGLTLAFGPGVSNAATASAAASAAPTSQTLYAVSCVPVSGTAYCWAVGASGTILVSYDDGRYWFRQYSGTTADLRGVTFVSATQGWAVGAAGTILDTTDGGAIWWLPPPRTRRAAAGTSAQQYTVSFPSIAGSSTSDHPRPAVQAGLLS